MRLGRLGRIGAILMLLALLVVGVGGSKIGGVSEAANPRPQNIGDDGMPLREPAIGTAFTPVSSATPLADVPPGFDLAAESKNLRLYVHKDGRLIVEDK